MIMKKVIVSINVLKIPYVAPETERIQVEMEDGFLVASASAGSGFGGQITDWASGIDNTSGNTSVDSNWN